MKLGIMQPYLFPYIGYFQLISAVDSFVFVDDVQWISRGWINRNRILMQGEAQYITLPVRKNSSRLNINKCELGENVSLEKKKILSRLQRAYGKAPHFKVVYSLVEHCFKNEENNASEFVANTVMEFCRYLRIDTPLSFSSKLGLSSDLKAEGRIIEINHAMKSEHYINSIGGQELYNPEHFYEQGLRLNFLETQPIEYQQFKNPFVSNLSIIDVLMFNSVEEADVLLTHFNLV